MNESKCSFILIKIVTIVGATSVNKTALRFGRSNKYCNYVPNKHLLIFFLFSPPATEKKTVAIENTGIYQCTKNSTLNQNINASASIFLNIFKESTVASKTKTETFFLKGVISH